MFPQTLLTVYETANLSSKNTICPSSVLTFLLIFQLVHFVFSLPLRGLFDKVLTILQVLIFKGFSHLEGAVAVAVAVAVWPVFFVCVTLSLDLPFLFPETMVFVVFELFCERIARSFSFYHATRLP